MPPPHFPYVAADDPSVPADLIDAIRRRRPEGRLLNLDRILLHSPPFARGWNGLLHAVRGELSLAPKLRELAILAIAVLNHAPYEWTQHEPEFLQAGGTAAQAEALRHPEAAMVNAVLFDERERAALALAIEMTRTVAVDDLTLARVQAAFSDREAIELIGTIAVYNMVARFLVATGLTPE
jgi:alkylhydroperoxidase family enzyme